MIPMIPALPYTAHPGLLLDLFFFRITIYNLMLAIACLIVLVVGLIQAKKKNKSIKHAAWMGFLTMLGIFFGSKLLYIITRWSWLMEDTSRWSIMISGGFVVYGGIIFAFLLPVIYTRLKKSIIGDILIYLLWARHWQILQTGLDVFSMAAVMETKL